MTRSIMLQGTGSDVGKTVLVAGLCRLARQRGLKVRPFKPQNMSNNAAVARRPDGTEGEIGRAQWLQALACGVPPTTDMNPVLLKPQSQTGSQVVVHGRVHGTAQGRDYQRLKAGLLHAVLESFGRLRGDADLVIVEGAGSPAEVNLRAGDIANMGFARAAKVPVILVGDIDRGGVIASLVGTQAVLDEADAAHVKAFLINKFRGDVRLFDEGLGFITERTGWLSLGVVTWLDATGRLPAEDSVELERLAARPRDDEGERPIVVVPILPRIANFDDLDPLRAEPALDVRLIRPGVPFPERISAIVLPGSKATVADLRALRAAGWDTLIHKAYRDGAQVIGLCGGYQMLGRHISDPHGIEEAAGTSVDGLGLLDVETVLEARKEVGERAATWNATGEAVRGYEIHMGRTGGPDTERAPFAVDGQAEGAMSPDGRVTGTYLHGLFDTPTFRRAWVSQLGVEASASDHLSVIEAALDELAAELDRLVDFDRLLGIAGTNDFD